MNNKQQFEAWLNPLWHLETFKGSDDSLQYRDEVIQGKWEAWQAASKASEQKLAAVVAENAGLKTYRPQPHGAAMMEALDAFFEHEDVPEQGMMASFEILCCKRPPTPATDAYLAEVRAQGVEMLATAYDERAKESTHYMIINHCKVKAEQAREFAAQLRQGAEHE